MARILAIDYGQKRIGVAVTDPLQMIANGLTTVETPKIYSFLADLELNSIIKKLGLKPREEEKKITVLPHPIIYIQSGVKIKLIIKTV